MAAAGNNYTGWVVASDGDWKANGTAAVVAADEVGRSGYSDYGGHGSVSYGGQGGYGSMAKYIDPFTLLAFAIFGAFLTYIYFYCIIKKNCIQFAACPPPTGSGTRRDQSSDTEAEKNEGTSELFSLVDRMLTAAQEMWELESDDIMSVM